MLLSREPLRDRLARRMAERKAARLAAEAKAPRRRPPSPKALAVADEKAVRDELKAIDKRAKQIEKALARPSPPRRVVGFGLPDFGTYEDQEMEAELRGLARLRREIEADRDRPITAWSDGRPLTDRDRAFRQMRTAELRQQSWHAAQRHERQGDHREARQRRLDALRARHIAEYEMKLRPSLRGYTHAG